MLFSWKSITLLCKDRIGVAVPVSVLSEMQPLCLALILIFIMSSQETKKRACAHQNMFEILVTMRDGCLQTFSPGLSYLLPHGPISFHLPVLHSMIQTAGRPRPFGQRILCTSPFMDKMLSGVIHLHVALWPLHCGI